MCRKHVGHALGGRPLAVPWWFGQPMATSPAPWPIRGRPRACTPPFPPPPQYRHTLWACIACFAACTNVHVAPVWRPLRSEASRSVEVIRSPCRHASLLMAPLAPKCLGSRAPPALAVNEIGDSPAGGTAAHPNCVAACTGAPPVPAPSSATTHPVASNPAGLAPATHAPLGRNAAVDSGAPGLPRRAPVWAPPRALCTPSRPTSHIWYASWANAPGLKAHKKGGEGGGKHQDSLAPDV